MEILHVQLSSYFDEKEMDDSYLSSSKCICLTRSNLKTENSKCSAALWTANNRDT